MTFRKTIIGTVLSASMLSGCTSHLAVKSIESDKAAAPLDGVIYYLPTSQYTVSTTYRISQCDLPVGKKIKVDVTPKVEHTTVAELKNIFTIDYRELDAATKAHNIDVQLYENGMLKSLTTGVQDKSVEITKALVDTGVKLALANTTGGASLLALNVIDPLGDQAVSGDQGDKEVKELPKSLCKDSVVAALKNAKTLKDTRDNKLKAADKKKVEVIALKNKLGEAKIDTEIAKLNKALVEAYNELATSFQEYQDAAYAYKENEKILSFSEKQIFVGSSDHTIKPKSKDGSFWFNDIDSKGLGKILTRKDVFLNLTTTHLKIHGLLGPDKAVVPCREKACKGLVYRQALPAKLSILLDSNPDSELVTAAVNIPDASPYAILPFENKEFQNNNFTAIFAESGLLTQFKTDSNATFEAQSTLASELATTRLAYKQKQAELDKLEEDAAITAQEKAISDAEAALAKEKAGIAAQIAEADAALARQRDQELSALSHQLAMLEEQKKLDSFGYQPQKDQELEDLERLLKLKMLLAEIDGLSTKEAQNELQRIIAENEIKQILADKDS